MSNVHQYKNFYVQIRSYGRTKHSYVGTLYSNVWWHRSIFENEQFLHARNQLFQLSTQIKGLDQNRDNQFLFSFRMCRGFVLIQKSQEPNSSE